MERFRGELVSEAHRLFVSLNSRLESNKKREEVRDKDLLEANVVRLEALVVLLLATTKEKLLEKRRQSP